MALFALLCFITPKEEWKKDTKAKRQKGDDLDKKKSFWPYGILLSIFAIVLACIATIIFASQYPVYEDDSFFLSYQEVKDNYDELETKQNNFDKNFALKLDDRELKEQVIDTKSVKKA